MPGEAEAARTTPSDARRATFTSALLDRPAGRARRGELLVARIGITDEGTLHEREPVE
ncbi:hypothetical protein [Streptomyces sp. NPDC058653]|uniref:hypothetical protein n=1 Tax=Streptomyces sp. NPDC058653 TaxID=3346576 RepID=UPI00365961F4